MISYRKEMNKYLYFTLFLILIGVLSSCNLFMVNPSLRENPNDDSRQITGFTAGPTGATSISTVWNWISPNDWLESNERIDEIKIIHSTLGYLDFNIPFVGQTFTDKSVWQYEWKDLKADSTHYFSLFAKTDDGKWIPSFKVKVTLPGTVESGVNYTRKNYIIIDKDGITYSGDIQIATLKWVVLFFDIPKNTFINYATITLTLNGSDLGSFEPVFAPLNMNLPDNDQDKWNSLADNSIVNTSAEKSFSAFPPTQETFEITDVVRAAVNGPQQAIVIKINSGISPFYYNNASAPYITADISK